MILSNELAAAEQRARDMLESFVYGLEEQSMTIDDGPFSQNELERLITRLAAVCRLAGRWAVMNQRRATNVESENTIRELARLMADVP